MKELILLFFEKLNLSLSNRNELLFSDCWNKQTYHRIYGGPEAISGQNLFNELCDNELILEPEPEFELNENGSSLLIGSFLKKENSSVDYIYFVMDSIENEFKISAASRSRIEMEAIIERMLPKAVSGATTQENSAFDITDEELFEQYFRDLNRAFINHSENIFASYWVDKAYYHNLSGEGGLSGQELYTIAKDAAWQLNPIFELSSIFEKPEAILIHLSIWLKTLEMEKPGEEGLLLLIKVENQVKILGYGTDLSAMRHLYLKYKEGSVL